MKLLVTGSEGMLGGELLRVAEAAGLGATGLSRGQLDLTDRATVDDAMADTRPDVVINCAAWTDVDGAEAHEQEAMEVNARGAGYLATAADREGAVICQISTDYVFDGTKVGPYVESDPTSPIQAYGRTKLAGEESVLEAAKRSFVVRTAWLYGSANARPNFVETMLKLGDSSEGVRVVSDQTGCPTWTGHLAEGILRLVEGTSYGIHHLAASGSCSWYEFASAIFSRSNLDPELVEVSSDEFPRPARRPANSVLVSEWETPVVLPEWENGLEEYLAERQSSDLGRTG